MAYKVLSNISHDGNQYVAGDIIEFGQIDDENAQQLIIDGIIENEQVLEAPHTEPVSTDEQVQPAIEPAAQTETETTLAESEAPVSEVPLENQPTQSDESSQTSNDELSLEQQVQENVSKDPDDSDKLADEPGKPVAPTAAQIEDDINQVENKDLHVG